ncbi:hypothetical protein [Spirosoma foliorum]|uniref:Uncharacterized protein n=1 Tax=Spirosoma foliorum TaxID=2710596 RepID=A0A7G5GZQ2_9BACT|nr:hypothetical protein [Spirosoma foliorum]QMW04344.1 hypothetical protein H3H32_05200 [Spirosoma foliorum]
MKILSYWARRHTRLAIFLIVLGEFTNGFNGVILGATILDKIPLAGLTVCMVLLIGVALFIQLYPSQTSASTNYWAGRRWLFVAFLCNFLLFGLLGGIWNQRIQATHPTSSVLGGRRIIVVGDSLSLVDTVRRATHSETKAASTDTEPPSRGLYVVLGILGIAVTYFMAALACTIACSGSGFLALLTLSLGLGGLAGSVYYFSKLGQKPLKRRRDMTADERRRDSGRFWRPWAILIGITSVILLIVALRN